MSPARTTFGVKLFNLNLDTDDEVNVVIPSSEDPKYQPKDGTLLQ